MVKIGAWCSVFGGCQSALSKEKKKARDAEIDQAPRENWWKAVRTIHTDGSEIPNNHPKDVSQTPMNSGTFTILTGE